MAQKQKQKRVSHKRRAEAKHQRRPRRTSDATALTSRRIGPIDPDVIYRPRDAAALFGFAHSQLYAHIAAGRIPRPVRLVKGGQAVGWYGRTILKHQQEREAEAAR